MRRQLILQNRRSESTVLVFETPKIENVYSRFKDKDAIYL